jgi:DNA ligase-1
MNQLSFINPSEPTPKFKPLLAFTVGDLKSLIYPVYASIKLDGIRAVILNGTVYSRSMKPIRSRIVQQLFGKPEFNGLDSEILYGEWNASDVFNQTTQAVMSFDLKPGFEASKLKLAVFDYADSDGGYDERFDSILRIVGRNPHPQIVVLEQKMILDEDELLAFEEQVLLEGYEGVMVRSMNGCYKQGRSTNREGILGKLKRFVDSEAVVIGFEERLHNTNEAKINELGHTQRSQAKAGMVGTGTLGALRCRCDGIEFSIGSGFNDAQRAQIWNNRMSYMGKIAKFKYQKIGMKNSYRMPIFMGWRNPDDL